MKSDADRVRLSRIEAAVRHLVALVGPQQCGLRGSPSPVSPGNLARALYQERRLRDRTIQPDVHSEATWDILLDLYASETEGKSVSVSSACLASGAPGTTALRHIRRLEDNRLVIRQPSLHDGRRIWLRLTDAGKSEMEEYLAQISLLRL